MRIGDTLYFDYQATTPPDPEVLEKMRPWQAESFGNPHSVDHIAGWRAGQAVESAAASIAKLIGADPDEIIFTSGATESNNLALLGIGRRAAFNERRRRVVIGPIEHKSVRALSPVLARQCDLQTQRIAVDHDGVLLLDALREIITGSDVLLVSVMAVNNEIGAIQPVEDIAAIAHEGGALFHCDAAQAPCAIDVSRLAAHADLISLSGHKMYGPKGIGVLYARREIHDQIEPLIYGGGQQGGLRSGTVPVPLCVGMAAAADRFAQAGAERERRTVSTLRDRFVQGLTNADITFALNGPAADRRHPGNISVRFPGYDAHEILGALQPRLAASTGSACTTGTPEPSYVLREIGLTDEEAISTIRFSLGRFTTADDVDEAARLVADVLSRLSAAEASASERALI